MIVGAKQKFMKRLEEAVDNDGLFFAAVVDEYGDAAIAMGGKTVQDKAFIKLCVESGLTQLINQTLRDKRKLLGG